ncbi:MAG: sel1 repeat family protein [Magnetovibrio sp.]|nr:sel1 repeat family protein [Magnetovibrio sp.]
MLCRATFFGYAYGLNLILGQMMNRCTYALSIFIAVLLTFLPRAHAQEPPFNDRYIAGSEAYRQGDFEAAEKNWRAAANYRHPQAAYNLALMYESGTGLSRDVKKAAYYHYIGAKAGSEEAAYRMGYLFAKHEVVREHWLDRIIAQVLTNAAKRGQPRAMLAYGLVFEAKANVILKNWRNDYAPAQLKGAWAGYMIAAEMCAKGAQLRAKSIQARLRTSRDMDIAEGLMARLRAEVLGSK